MKLKKDDKVYYIVLLAIVGILIFVAASAYCGLFTGNSLVTIEKVQKRSGDVSQLESDIKKLEGMSKTISEVQERFEKLKYPNKATLRENINTEFVENGVVIDSITVKDYAIQDESGGRKKAKKNTSTGLVLINITGEIKPENIPKFLTVVNNKQHFWYITDMKIALPEGINNLFGETFRKMSPEKRKEVIDSYLQTSAGHDMSVNIEFITCVK